MARPRQFRPQRLTDAFTNSTGHSPTNVTLTDIYQLPAVPTRCSAVAAVATDSTQTSTQLAQELYDLRKNIVLTANANCNADGTSTSSGACTPGGLGGFVAPILHPHRFTLRQRYQRGYRDQRGQRTAVMVAITTEAPVADQEATTDHDDNDPSRGITASAIPPLASCYANLDLTPGTAGRVSHFGIDTARPNSCASRQSQCAVCGRHRKLTRSSHLSNPKKPSQHVAQ